MKKRSGFKTKVQISWSLTQNTMSILMKKKVWDPKNLELKRKFFFK